MANNLFVPRDKYDALTECSICCDKFKEPTALPCMHVFCKSPCLTKWAERNNICPTCRLPFNMSQTKKFHYLENFMEEMKEDSISPCSDCGSSGVTLENCEHCSKQICRTCIAKHIQTLKQEVALLCEKLTTETAPKLEEQNLKIMTLMSESTSAKERLTRELREVHETLVAQIYSLRQQSINILNDIEKSSRPGGENGLEEIDALLARIDSMCASSANIVQERDIRKLMQLDSDISKLQKDIEAFHAKEANNGIQQMNLDPNRITLDNIKINQAYKNIAAQIEDTDMLKKTGF